MKFIVHGPSFIVFLFAAAAFAQPVRITLKPDGLVHGTLLVPASVAENVTRISPFFTGGQGNSVGEEEMVVNDPQPPFRAHLQNNAGALSVAIVKPPDLQITSADFF